MPKADKQGHAKDGEIPSTLERSDQKAQDTFAQTYDSAMETYNEDESRAARTAWAAVKHTHEKVGDHWEPKDSKDWGPSDERAAEGGPNASGKSYGGVDANATKGHLYEIAQKLDIDGRSNMSKDELAEAIQKASDRETRRANEGSKKS